jgi:PTH1 family peptidyl-tRNA hydrolase
VKAVFGLGNPGLTYVLTRHNVGFEAIDLYRKLHRVRRKARIQHSALVYRHRDLLLCKPMTFMNDSGRAVRGVLAKHRVSASDALIVYDDLDLPLGRIKVLSSGGAGSHNGMKSVLEALGTEDVPRLRIGIEVEERRQTGRDFVLDRFTPEEWSRVVPAIERTVDAIALYARADIDAVMTQFNRRDEAVVD